MYIRTYVYIYIYAFTNSVTWATWLPGMASPLVPTAVVIPAVNVDPTEASHSALLKGALNKGRKKTRVYVSKRACLR